MSSLTLCFCRRENSVKKLSQLCPKFTSTGTFPCPSLSLRACCLSYSIISLAHRAAGMGSASIRVANTDWLLGACTLGPACRYTHDLNRLAICKDFLQKGSCTAADACDLSHEPTPHRVPACLHFLRGNCTNDSCRYAHVHVNPSAPVCRDFAKLGYCEKGPECVQRHVYDCPDYANNGVCRNKNCRLPHVDRAGQIRKAVVSENEASREGDDSADFSSDEDYHEINSDDVNSDGLEEADDYNMSEQHDFIHL